MKFINLIQIVRISTLALLIGSTGVNAAQWVIDNQHSQLNFISTKKVNIAEVHQFRSFQGALDSNGQFELTIDLLSVDTNSAVRDERMTKYLFDVEQFSTATLTANIDLAILDAIAQGAASVPLEIDANLSLHGETKSIKLNVIISRLVGAKLAVVSAQPVIVKAEDFALVSGVNKLMELAKLPSISHAVPVSFYLTLNLKP